MIRINLLVAEPLPEGPSRSGAARVAAMAGGAVVLGVVLGLMAWDGLATRRESNRLDERMRVLDRQLAGLAGVGAQREEVERRRDDLARRVALAETLRAAQRAPARLLEQVGRVVPEDAWLTEMRLGGGRVTLTGRAAEMSGLAELVAGLEASGHFLPPVEIVDSRRDGEAVHFEIRARFSLASS
jgi:Tfp pilus assembly protein PilN